MPDDLYTEYGHYSHRELYAMLMTGSPQQIQEMLTTWKSAETTTSEVAAALRADLARLLSGWDSPAGREFDRRVGLVAAYAQSLAEEFAAIQTGLQSMSLALQQAMRRAEPPDAYEQHHDEQAAHAAGVSVLGSLGGVIGGLLGHELDQIEKDKAHSRMIRLVCALASDYRITDYGTWPPKVPVAHPDTPGAHDSPDVPDQQPQPKQPEHTEHHDEHHAMDMADARGYPAQPGVEAGPAVLGVTVDQSQEWWRGTAPAIVGVVAAGGLIAAAVTGERSRDGSNPLALEADGEHSDVTTDADGVVRNSAHSTALGIDTSTSSGSGSGVAGAGPAHVAAGATQDGTALAGSDSADQNRGTPPPPPPAAATGFGSTGLAGAGGSGGITSTGAVSSGGVVGGADPSSMTGRGPDTHRWLSEGRMTWGDDGRDPSSLIHPPDSPIDPGVEPEPEPE